MRLFLDTEFTSLTPAYKIISIALVDENENYFYAELNDTYELSQCTDFVKTTVLPLLKGGKYAMSKHDCTLALCKWIKDIDEECIICSDNPHWDMPLLLPLLQPIPPANLNLTKIQYIKHSPIEIALIHEFNFNVHCALDDAMIMKKATMGY